MNTQRSAEEMQHTVRIEQTDDLVIMTVIDPKQATVEEDIQRAQYIVAELEQRLDQANENGLRAVYDIRQLIEPSEKVPEEVRKIFLGIIKDSRLKKVAILGNDDKGGAIKFMLELLQQFGLGKVAWFVTEAEMNLWLHSAKK